MENIPKIGVGVIVTRGKTVLLGKRKRAHGEGTWSFPGGHLEFGEDIETCAAREVKEETGITVHNLKKGPYTNDFFKTEKKHYVTLFIIAEWKSGDVKILEPEKCERWEWFPWDDLPEPLFLPIQNLLRQCYNPFSCL